MAQVFVDTHAHPVRQAAQTRMNSLRETLRLSSDWLDGLQRTFDPILALVDDYERLADDIRHQRQTGDLGATGEAKALAKVQEDYRKKLAELTAKTPRGREQSLKDMRAKFREPPPEASEADKLFLWQYAQAMDARRRDEWYKQEANDWQQQVLESCKIPLVSDAARKAIQDLRLDQRHPGMRADIEGLEAMQIAQDEVEQITARHFGVEPEHTYTGIDGQPQARAS